MDIVAVVAMDMASEGAVIERRLNALARLVEGVESWYEFFLFIVGAIEVREGARNDPPECWLLKSFRLGLRILSCRDARVDEVAWFIFPAAAFLSSTGDSGTKCFPPTDSMVILRDTSHEFISSGSDSTIRKVRTIRRASEPWIPNLDNNPRPVVSVGALPSLENCCVT